MASQLALVQIPAEIKDNLMQFVQGQLPPNCAIEYIHDNAGVLPNEVDVQFFQRKLVKVAGLIRAPKAEQGFAALITFHNGIWIEGVEIIYTKITEPFPGMSSIPASMLM